MLEQIVNNTIKDRISGYFFRIGVFKIKANKSGWLAPTIQNKIKAHLKVVDNVCKILPITKIVVETASFDTQKLKNPTIEGVEYQQGEQLNFWNVREHGVIQR